MAVGQMGPVAVNGPLRSLLGIHEAQPSEQSLSERFEIVTLGGDLLAGDQLPWRRAARNESFVDNQVWYDRRTAGRLFLHLRSASVDGQTLITFDDLAEQSFLLRLIELVGELGVALVRAEDPLEVAPALVTNLARVVSADAAFLFVAAPNGRQLKLLASVGLARDFQEQAGTVPLDAPIVMAQAARTLEIQEVEWMDDLPERGPPGTRRLHELGVRSVVALPLVSSGELMGVLGLARKQPGKLAAVERRILQGLAAACALGLRQARLRMEQRREAVRLRTLREAALAVQGALPLRDLLRTLVGQGCELTGARYGALGVLDPDGGGLADFVFTGVPESVAQRIGRLPRGEGLLGAVIREQSPIRVADIGKDPRRVGFPPHHPAMTSFLGVPLRVGAEVFGNIYLCDKEGHGGFTDEDQRLLELFAAQSALAIGYARQIQLTERAHGQLDRLRDELAAVVAHDLRNPVSAILMRLDGLVARAEGDTVAVPVTTLQRMKRVGQRLNQLVADLLDASRVEMGRVVLERRPLSIGQTVRALVDEIAPTLGEHPLDLDLDEGAPLVDVDPGRLDQIVTNLLDNAAKYSPPGTTIRVHVGGTADGAVLTVEDHGEGIAPGEIPLLFDRLHQGPRTRIRKGGLGLGLYITKGLVEAHGGRIWVESEHGRGSRFHVWLPRVGDIGTSADAQPGRPS